MAGPPDIRFEQRQWLPNRRKSVEELLGNLRETELDARDLNAPAPEREVHGGFDRETPAATAGPAAPGSPAAAGEGTRVGGSPAVEAVADLRAAVDRAFDLTSAIAEAKAAEYRRAVGRLRLWSFFFRAGALLALLVGLAAPLLDVLFRSPGAVASPAPNIGYAAMVLGGALVLADRVFVATSRWARLLEAQVCLEDITLAFNFEWQRRRLQWSAETLTAARVDAELAYLARVADEIMEEVKLEAREWANELRQGASALGTHLSLDQASAAMRQRVADRAGRALEPGAAAASGALEVEVAFEGAPENAVAEVAVGEPNEAEHEWERRQLDARAPVALFTVPQGRVTVSVASDSAARSIAEFVTVGADTVRKRYDLQWARGGGPNGVSG